MKKQEIRLRYSGFIVFGTQVLSVITGLIFTLLLTRNMNPAQYGIWTNIFDYTGYFVMFSGLLPFWATRFVARNIKGTAKTSVLAQFLLALISFVAYFPAIILISQAIGTQAYLPIYFIAGGYILTYFMINIFESILQSTKPQAVGYGLMIEEISKVSIALIVILGFRQLFLGAILALVVSCIIQIVYYYALLRHEFNEKTNWSYLKEWLKGSTAIAYNSIGSQIFSFVYILLFIYGGAATRAYYQAAFTFTNIVGYSASLAFAVYPKLLSNSCSEEQIGTSFRTVLMLAIPFATIVMVMSTSFLIVLNSAYAVAWPVLIALTFDTLISIIFSFYSNILMGREAFDSEGKISLRKLVRSKIILVFSVSYIQAAIALPVTYYVLTALPIAGSVQATLDVILILFGVHLSTFIGLYAFLHHKIWIPVAWKGIAEYILSALLMGGIMLFVIPAPTTLLPTIGKAIAGFGIYVLLLLAIDKQARELIRLIWKEIKGSIQQVETNNISKIQENSST